MSFLAAASFVVFVSACSTSSGPRYDTNPLSARRAYAKGEINQALASYEAQAREAEKNAEFSWFPQRYWEEAAAAYNQASRAALSAGHLQESIAYGRRAVELAAKAQSPLLQHRATRTLIVGYRSVRDFDKVKDLIERGLKVVKEIPPNTTGRLSSEAGLYRELGTDFIREREYEKAVEVFQRALSLQEGSLALRIRNPTILENQRLSTIDRLADLANAYRLAGRLDQGLEQYQRAFKLVQQWGLNYSDEGNFLRGMGEIYFQQKNFSEALESFKKAVALAESQQRPYQITAASRRIADTLRTIGKTAEAIPYYQRAIDQIESTRSLLESEEYRQSYFEGALRTYGDIVIALLLSGKTEEAFNYSERARSRTFLDVLGTRVQLSKVKTGLFEEERALNERISGIKLKLAAEEDAPDNASLRRELGAAERAYNTFLARVKKENKEQASLMNVEPLKLDQVQELLDSDTALISYFIAGRSVRVWIVEKTRMHYVEVQVSREQLSKLVKTLRESIFALGEREKFTVASTELYKLLVEPALPHVRGKELIIVPHDVLHYLPFHALLGSDGKYLIEKYPVYYLSSASLLQFVKEKRRAGGNKVIAFGNPDLGDPDKNLEFAELEAQEVKAAYPESTVYLRKEATEEKSKVLSPRHDILHFATHAELSENDPLSSAVLLAKEGKEDGRLEVREIFGMDLKANLVVLSGCETGLGKLSTGDELVGLTRAFIYAGTPSVVASLWKVDDSSTAHLMSSFYRNLKTMSKVDALRQAQLALIRGEGRSDLLARRGVGGIGKLGETPSSGLPAPSSQLHAPSSVSTSHPYFWAPFILVGDGK